MPGHDVVRSSFHWRETETGLCRTAQPAGSAEGKAGGQQSMRVTDQWRVCSIWKDRDAYEIEIVDYH
jgi:hypothetical protein